MVLAASKALAWPLVAGTDGVSGTKKMAVLRLTAEAFRELLQLPPEVEVLRVNVPYDMRGRLDIVIEGVGWDVPENGAICPTYGSVTRQVDGEGSVLRSTIDWGFPQADQQ